MNNSNSNKEEFYLYLDFGEQVNNDVFTEPVHLRIENLHKENPLVQLNERVFKGTFDHSMGTNIFFEASVNQTQSDVLDRKTSVHLDYIASQTKVLALEPVKIKPRKPDMSSDQFKIKYYLKWDYETLLKKWDDGTLDIKDMIKDVQVIPLKEYSKDVNHEIDEEEETVEITEPAGIIVQKKNCEMNEYLAKELKENYQRLKLLSKRPVRRKIIQEAAQKCDDKFKQTYELHNIEKQILQQRYAFTTEDITELNENTLTKFIDIHRCILYGVLKPSKAYPRILTPKERTVVLNLQNIDNLSLAARYYVIDRLIEKMEKQLENMSDEELQERDEYERTLMDTLNIYTKLRSSLSKRLTEIKSSISELTLKDDNSAL